MEPAKNRNRKSPVGVVARLVKGDRAGLVPFLLAAESRQNGFPFTGVHFGVYAIYALASTAMLMVVLFVARRRALRKARRTEI